MHCHIFALSYIRVFFFLCLDPVTEVGTVIYLQCLIFTLFLAIGAIDEGSHYHILPSCFPPLVDSLGVSPISPRPQCLPESEEAAPGSWRVEGGWNTERGSRPEDRVAFSFSVAAPHPADESNLGRSSSFPFSHRSFSFFFLSATLNPMLYISSFPPELYFYPCTLSSGLTQKLRSGRCRVIKNRVI